MLNKLINAICAAIMSRKEPDERQPPSDAYTKVLGYLTGESSDHRGRVFGLVLAQDNEWWTDKQDFIQWVFPSTEPSEFHGFSPVLTAQELALLGQNEKARAGLLAGYARLLDTLGLAKRGDGTIFEPPSELDVFRPAWLRRPDQFDYRITRMLATLTGAGMHREVDQFMTFIEDTVALVSDKAVSLNYWRHASGSTQAGLVDVE